ncbi:MAG: LAGLIDADG family homing endonuclease [Candidatus Micrarchaeota archaeon]
MKYDHDVIVIGGGPAGSTFARIAAGGGLDVLVIDKRKEIGVPVRCGEGLSDDEIVKEGLDLPKKCLSVEIEGARIIAPNGRSITWKTGKTSGWVLERKFFDKWLAELAVEKGAKVKTYTRATELITENGKPAGVKLSHGGREPYEVRAPIIVSAEGMESFMARAMGFKTIHSLYDVDTCYQYEMKPYDHENLIELYFGNKAAPRGYCLTPDSEIIAKNTVKPITEIKRGEEVLTLHGWMPVSDTSVRDYDGEIIRITPFMLNQSVGLTSDHLVFVWNKKQGFHWKKAGKILKSKRGDHRKGDYLVFPLPKEKNGGKNIKIDELVKDGWVKEGGFIYPKGKNQFGAEFKYKLKHRLNNELQLTNELLEFFGYFISEGNVSRGSVIISNTDTSIIERVHAIGAEAFGFEPYIHTQKKVKNHKTCYQVQFSSMILRKLFKALFGEGCENKKLPFFVHSLENSQKLALLKGLFRGDGSKWKSTEGMDVVSYVSMSKTLIFDIWMLLAGIGIVGAVKRNRKKNAYEIRIRGKQLKLLGDIFEKYATGGREMNRGFFIVDNYIVMGIRKLERRYYKGKVYDIESAGSFCPFFAVHNCWIFPKSDRKANVGIGIGGNVTNAEKPGNEKGADPKRLLEEFIAKDKQLKDASTLLDFGGVISVGAPIDSFVKDNCMVIGTAAKQVDPIHGGGIAIAMESGVLAAQAALEAFRRKDFSAKVFLEHYESPWRKMAGKRLGDRLKLRKVMEKVSDDDLNHIFNTIGAGDIAQIMDGDFAPSVAKVIAGRPQLLGALRALV